MICPVCQTEKKWRDASQIEALGKCAKCYKEEQPLVRMPGGSYLPWECVYTIHYNGSISNSVEERVDTKPAWDGVEDRAIPKITFCEKYKKWKLSYNGHSGEIGDYGATSVERYFDTKEEIFELMTEE
jgi:hypothetical protein